MSDNRQEKFKKTIVIDSNESSVDVITINSSDLNNNSSDDAYKVSSDGEVVNINLVGNLKESYLKGINSKSMLIKELIKYGFDKIPVGLNEIQLINILEFSMTSMIKNVNYGKIYPFSVEKNDNGDLVIVLLMYNWNEQPFTLGNIPLKLKDASGKVVFANLVDLTKEIGPKKIGIYYVEINKETLKEDDMDLTKWTITFEP